MPQTITIQVGQCGNQIGELFWNHALQEQALHNVDGKYNESLSTFFRNADSKNGVISVENTQNIRLIELKGRAVLVDMEEGVLNQIKASEISGLFDSHQYISSNSGSGNNWAHGYHEYGSEFGDAVFESIRIEAECCDGLQSIMMLQSTGGGTGSGLGSYIQERIADEYPELWRFSTAVVPSETDDVITSPYNAILSLAKICKNADCILPVDNQSLLDIYKKINSESIAVRKLETSLVDNVKLYDRKKNESYSAVNNIVANLLLNLTSSIRFEGQMNVDINDIVTNMVPFKNLNFLTSSMSPLFVSKRYGTKNIDQVFSDAFLPHSQLLSVDTRKGKSLANALIVRGNIPLSVLRRNIERLNGNFVSWNVNGWKTGLCDVPPIGQSHSVLALSNNTSITTILDRLSSRFKMLFKRKAHLHHYLNYSEKSEFMQSIQMIDEVRNAYLAYAH